MKTVTIRWHSQKHHGEGEATENKEAKLKSVGSHFALSHFSPGGIVLALVLCVLSAWNIQAQVSTPDQVNYVKTVWNITSVSDDAIEAALEYNPNGSSYSGIPYKGWISFLVAAPDIYAAVENDDYRTAARLAGNFGASTAFNTALAEVGLDSVFSIASLAEFPLEFELNSFATAVKNASFQKQVEFYFAVRAANGDSSLNAVLQLQPGDIIEASGSVAPQGFLLVDDAGWLSTGGSYLYGDPSGCTPAQFYVQAENLHIASQSGSQLSSISTDLGNLFRARLLPIGPVINQHPQSGTYVQGGSFQLSVGATGTQPLTYQWLLNGTSISGANGSTYILSGGQAGVFTVSVTDANSQSVLSQAATVTMLPSSTSAAFITPTNGATLSGTIRVQAAASAATEIDYYVDGILRFTSTITPFLWTWNTAVDDDGAHTVIAKAYIGHALVGTSPSQPVAVNNGGANTCGDPNEPNNSSLTATPLALGATNNVGLICTPTDVDWFKVGVTNAGLLQINLQVPVGKDFDLELYGPNAAWLAGSYNPAGIPESIQQVVAVPGIYYFRVYGYPLGAGDSSATSTYAVSAALTALASTNPISGGVTNATWSGVVNLTGDVTIGAGSVLTILPGTVIQCQPDTDGQAGGANPNRVEIILSGGTVNAVGTVGAPIVFTSAGPVKTPGDWYGVRILEGNVTLSNCVVEYEIEGMRFEDNDTRFNNYALGNVTVQRCSGDGVWTSSGQYASVTLNNFQLWTNQTGLSANGPVTLVGGQAVGNSGYGFSGNNATLVATGTTMSRNGGFGICSSGGGATLTGCVVSNNQSYGVYAYQSSLIMSGSTVVNNSGEGVYAYQNSSLNMSACTVSHNNGWGVNMSQGGSAEVWNSVVQSNGSGGLVLGNSVMVGVVSNTISSNSGTGLQLSNFGVSASGITGNVITGNGGVGVELSGGGPSSLTVSGNDIYQNTSFELRNDSGITIIANNDYWGEPTTTEFNQGQINLSRIYDSHDNPSSGQVLVQGIRTSSMQNTLEFVQQPQSVTAYVGATVVLSPVVTGTAPISYQWYDNGLVMPQATNLTLTLSGVTVGNSGGYFQIISNASGVVASSVAFVAVLVPPGAPTIIQQPQSQSVLAGATVGFSVTAGGAGPFTYHWQKDSVAITGATNSTYTIATAVVNDTGAYTVIVSNGNGSTSSQAATLTVNVLTGSAINRTITTNGSNFAVSLAVAPPAGTPGYMVEETLPVGFTATNISAEGASDSTNNVITWGPFWDGLARNLTYTLVPPPGFSGAATLSGEALLFGATATTGGDSTVQVGPPPMQPRLALIQFAPGLFGMSITGEVGRTYRVEASDNLRPGTWTSLITVIVTESPFEIIDPDSVGKPTRFYRIVVLH